MGRYVKNFETNTNAYAVRMPVGGGIIGPDHPVDGLVRFNVTNNFVEYYSNNQWHAFAKNGKVDIVKDEYLGDGVTTTFGPMSYNYLPNRETDVLVFIGNIFQNPGVAYTITGNQIVFTSVPNSAQPIVILHNLNSTNAV